MNLCLFGALKVCIHVFWYSLLKYHITFTAEVTLQGKIGDSHRNTQQWNRKVCELKQPAFNVIMLISRQNLKLSCESSASKTYTSSFKVPKLNEN